MSVRQEYLSESICWYMIDLSVVEVAGTDHGFLHLMFENVSLVNN